MPPELNVRSGKLALRNLFGIAPFPAYINLPIRLRYRSNETHSVQLVRAVAGQKDILSAHVMMPDPHRIQVILGIVQVNSHGEPALVLA